MKRAQRALILGLSLVLIACAGGVSRPSKRSDNQKAAEIQVQLGSGYMQRGMLDLAMERLQRAVQLDPRSAMAHSMLGVLYEQINDKTNAELHYSKSVNLPGSVGSVSNNFGQFLCRYNRFDEADAQFQTALQDPFYPSHEVAATNAGFCALRAKRLEDAERYLRSALERKPDFAAALLPMAEVLAERQQFMSARAFLQRYEATGEAESAAMLDLGVRIETALNDPRAATDYRERLLRNFASSPEARRYKE
jgi:type IV pilus assembly protein PilF